MLAEGLRLLVVSDGSAVQALPVCLTGTFLPERVSERLTWTLAGKTSRTRKHTLERLPQSVGSISALPAGLCTNNAMHSARVRITM